MNSKTKRAHARSVTCFAALFGTASFAALASSAAFAQGAPAAAAPAPQVEEVLVTGSLIRGGTAVGVPVTALSDQDFKETGEISLTNVLKSVPALRIDAEPSPTYGGGTLAFEQNVQIHGIGTGAGVETLLLVDGYRWPAQNYSGDTVNPSIVPQIAIDRVDVLTAGASAVYGSDATVGVINIILKRGYDGAMTQASFGMPTESGTHSASFSQLYGKTWDGGDITVSYEYTEHARLLGSARPFYTQNFEPYGLMDYTPLASSVPGVITTGKPHAPSTTPVGFSAALGTRFCDNCYSIPAGTGWNYGDTPEHTNPTVAGSTPTTSWATLLSNPGVKNERNPWADGYARPQLQTNSATMTFDQELFPGVSLFGEGFYANQRGTQVYPPGNSEARTTFTDAKGVLVPTNNPYRPSGAPAGIDINYSLALEMPMRVAGGEVAGRYTFGFNLDELPFDWHGKVAYSVTDDHNYGNVTNAVNPNNLSAALGNVVTDPDGVIAPYTKPANVPYLNLFCDSRVYKCNSQATLDYLASYRLQDERWKVNETTVNFDGPVFDLPGGPVRAAIAGQVLTQHYTYANVQNDNTANSALINNTVDSQKQASFAIFGQVDVPIIGEANALPLIKSLDVEGGYRYDKYDNLPDPVYTPKLAVNWGVGGGLTFRGSWGKSFRVPAFAEDSAAMSTIQGANALGGSPSASSNIITLGCSSIGGSTPNVALPGSLTALLNPTCSGDVALRNPGGIIVGGSGGGAAVVLRGGSDLQPQTVHQWSVGANFRPTDTIFGINLSGINIDATLFNLNFKNLISGNDTGQGADDPASRSQYVVIPNPSLPITDPSNADFYSLVKTLAALPSRNEPFDPTYITNIKFIQDSALINVGTRKIQGIDFDARYDFDAGDWGTWTVGAAGYYELKDQSQVNSDVAVDDKYKDKNSGNRLQRVRYRLGWTDNSWSVTGFANYVGHGAINTDGNALIPPCYYMAGYAPGSCYAGSQYFGPTGIYPNYSPATVTFDLSIGYQTGDMPANEYLKNIGFQLTINNILNKPPVFQVGARGHGSIRAFDNSYDDLQRVVNFAITKVW